MDEQDKEDLKAHLARYGIPLPEDTEFGRPRIEVGRKMEQITRRLNETEQDALFWQDQRFG